MSNFQQKITHHSLRRQKKNTKTKTESKPDSSITSFLKSENFKYVKGDNGKKKKEGKQR